MQIESEFVHPPLRETVASLEAYFRSDVGLAQKPLRNYHQEPQVDEETRRHAKPAAVLIPIVEYGSELRLLLTRRNRSISFGGRLCFPGGVCDSEDRSREETALRESREEIGLASDKVRVIGRLGDYVSHSGHRIAPIVGFVESPLQLELNPTEVEDVVEIPLDRVFDSDSYQLRRMGHDTSRAHYCLVHHDEWVVGLTASIVMGFYEELLESRYGPSGPRASRGA